MLNRDAMHGHGCMNLSGSDTTIFAEPPALAAGLALTLAFPAQAQIAEKLVGNTTKTAHSGSANSSMDRAQAFDTGNPGAGYKDYKLTAVKVEMSGGVLKSNFNTLTANLYLADNTSGHPTGDSLGDFDLPSGTTAGNASGWSSTGNESLQIEFHGYAKAELTPPPLPPPRRARPRNPATTRRWRWTCPTTARKSPCRRSSMIVPL